jgi:hypothetical protein
MNLEGRARRGLAHRGARGRLKHEVLGGQRRQERGLSLFIIHGYFKAEESACIERAPLLSFAPVRIRRR